MVALSLGRDAPGAGQDLLSSISFKFAASHRLLRKNGFDHVMQAESILDKYFKIFFVYNNDEKNARLGIIASKKMLNDAVDRNCVKRIIRERFRQHNIKDQPVDIVVMVKRASPMERSAQDKSLEMLFSRIENRCAEQ